MIEIISQTLKGLNGKYSEKRITKMVVIGVLLILTIFDTVASKQLREAIFYGWLGLLGHEGYRMTKEKEIKKDEVQ